MRKLEEKNRQTYPQTALHFDWWNSTHNSWQAQLHLRRRTAKAPVNVDLQNGDCNNRR